MSTPIKRYKFIMTSCGNYMSGEIDGDYVLHSDHIAIVQQLEERIAELEVAV